MNTIGAMIRLAFKEITRKKDFYVVLILLAVILFYTAQIRIYDISSIVRYVREIALALIFFFSAGLMVSVSARQLPGEKNQRTLGVLMAKPVTRGQFVAGKFAAAFCAGGSAFLIFYSVFIGVSMTSTDPAGGIILFQTGYLYLLGLAVLAALSSSFSYFMTFGANVSASFIVYLTMMFYGEGLDLFAEHAGMIPKYFGKLLYYALPHFEFFDIRTRLIHDWPALPWSLIGILTAYAGVMCAFLLFAAWLKFRKQVI